MIKRSIESYSSYKVFITAVDQQYFISVSVIKAEENSVQIIKDIYENVADLLSASGAVIVHERCFGDIEIQPHILQIRQSVFYKKKLEVNTPVTFIEGKSTIGNKFAGLQIRAIKLNQNTQVKTIHDQGNPKGRVWNINGSTFYLLHNVDGGGRCINGNSDRKSHSEAMFNQADMLLRSEGATFQDVVRTWIYLSDILDWYHDFNIARNNCYAQYGFLHNNGSVVEAEKIYLPASTGIGGNNSSRMPATMDVFAVRRSPGSNVNIRPIYGEKQRSPYRYGSAFSRAMVVEEPNNKMIFVSGTASIDEEGRSVFNDDPAEQIRHTFNVLSALISPEGGSLQDFCEATVFLKRQKDFPIFETVMKELGMENIPSINVIADVCRDELLFEIDAAFVVGK